MRNIIKNQQITNIFILYHFSDCGVFSCMFAEFTSRDSKITFDQSRMEYFRAKMVFEIMTGRLLL